MREPDTSPSDFFAHLPPDFFARLEEALTRLQEACGRRWEARVLAHLAVAGSLGRAQITKRINEFSRRYFAETQAARALDNLMARGLVLADTSITGRKPYRLTSSGRDEAYLLLRLAGIIIDDRSEVGAAYAATRSFRTSRSVTDLASSPDVARLAEAWFHALRGNTPIPLTRSECFRVLSLLASDIYSAATAHNFEPHVGRAIGANLLTAGFRSPGALGSTITVITTLLPGLLPLPSTEASIRTTRLVEHLAIGFTRALRDHTLSEQEAFHRAVFGTRRRPPQRSTKAPRLGVRPLELETKPRAHAEPEHVGG